MEPVFENAKWICLKPSARNKKNAVNPWETVIDEKIRKTDIPDGGGIPVFYKAFPAEKPVKKCVIHITALGCFNLYMNGRKIGSDELMPGWTDYSKRVLYYSYDVSEFIEPANAVAVPVAPGWWAGRISLDTYDTDNNVGLICAIAIEYEDGETEVINSDLTWKGTSSGRVRYADIWDGEVYDANYDAYEEIAQASYPKSKFRKPAMEYHKFKGVISPKIGPSVCIRDFLDMKPVTAVIYDAVLENGSDYGEIRTIQTIESPARKTPIVLKKGRTVIYDLGQNMVGWEHFTVRGNPHTTVTMRHAEMLNDSGEISRGNDGPKGSLYTANYRSAKAKGKYTLRGDETGEEYRPSFTFYGFRYVELTATDDIEILDFYCDVVGSDNAETGFIETSNADVNRLFQNIRWGQRGNYLSVPTDCPQRDERLGWTGDTQIFACTAAYNANVRDFFHKWMQDMRDSQRYGAFSDVAPRSRVVGEGNAAWADAGIIVPYIIYKMYGDITILEESYESIMDYMDYLSVTNMRGPHPAYGDWLSYEHTENQYVCMAYYAYDALLVSKISAALSKDEDDSYAEKAMEYAELYEKVKYHFQKTYLDKHGKLTQNSQTAYLLALKFGLLPESYQAEVKHALAAKIRRNGYRLSTGFVGSGILNQTLSEIGESNLAYSLLLQKDDPSWLYSVYQGATTIWERWNSYTIESGFGEVAMNSFNHYAYGAVAEWMYKYMAGIETDENKPGFRHILLQPKPDTRKDNELPSGQERITWVRASYESASGKIECSWRMEEDTFSYEVTIPGESYATLYLPIFDPNAKTVTVNGRIYATDSLPAEKDCLLLYLPSGHYEIETLL